MFLQLSTKFERSLFLVMISLSFSSSPFSGPEQIQGSFRNQVLQSESCSME